MVEESSQILQWLHANQQLILVVIGFISFIESAALLGIFVPGIMVLFAAGSAAGSTGIPLGWVLGAAFLGSVLGDCCSYLLGYHYHEQIRRLPLLQRHPTWIERGERFFRQYGMMSVVIGRFVGPLRPVMPLVAGFMQMPPSRFYPIDILSALAWAPFFLMPGYLVGSALEGPSALNPQHAVLLVGSIFAGWLLAQLLWLAHQQLKQRSSKLHLALGLAIGCSIAFGLLSQLMQLPLIERINTAVATWNLALRHPWLDYFFVGLTRLGYRDPMTVWAVSVAVALVLQRNYYACVLWLGTNLLGSLLLTSAKLGFGWARPELIAHPPATFAFPSGHTSGALIMVGALAMISLSGFSSRRQKVFLSSAGIIVALMATSRLYLTVHWLTDILGGLMLGGLVLSALYALLIKRPLRPIQVRPILIATAIAWTLNIGLFVVPELSVQLSRYQPETSAQP